MHKITQSFRFGEHTVTLETGEMARQASGSVLVDMDGTIILVTAVAMKEAKAGQDFFPLTVNYQERMYAAGRIPGGFFKREGRPSERETLISRLIDRPIRPLFPEGFLNEIQVIATVISLNPEVEPDIPALIGASAALALSGVPFMGPVGAARVGFINNKLVLNPTNTQLSQSRLDLVVAGTKKAVLMVESEADQLPEDLMLEAVMFGFHASQQAIAAIEALVQEAGKPKWDWQPEVAHLVHVENVRALAESGLTEAYAIREKQQRRDAIAAVKQKTVEALCLEGGPTAKEILALLSDLESRIVRGRILAGEPRIDGRDTETVRPITTRIGVLPRTHGSALFTRGETQALVVATLGTGRDAQVIDNAGGERKDAFMLHYNFPPFSVGEVGIVGSPKRREIGHGRLAKRGIQSVLPDVEDYPYVLRVVSEVLESNGSSSMATVCGTSMALMDAGVPLKAPVAGIAMGLIKEENVFAVLTDILGDEDHLGDMDFKVAGSAKGVTALQMDIKTEGIDREIMHVALSQARDARLHILGEMEKTISTPRTEMSEFAPRTYMFKINPDKIRDVIGKGGATIRQLTEEFGASIDISDDGKISIVALDGISGENVCRKIQALTAEVEVGKIYEGKVARLADFGAFVNILPGKDGLVHVSQMSHERVEEVSDFVTLGQTVRVKVLEIDRQGRVRLSMKDLSPEEEGVVLEEESDEKE